MSTRKHLPLFLSLIILLFSNNAISGDWSYYVHDHLGNTRVVLDESGNTRAYYDYFPYGKLQRAYVAGSDAKYKFTGKEYDNEDGIGLYYFGARYYDPEIGRWFVTDPAGQFSSPYVYSGNSPLMMVDPNGEFAWFIAAGILVGAWTGGAIANDWQLNPLKWDYSSPWTYLGIAAGGTLGGIGGAGLQYSYATTGIDVGIQGQTVATIGGVSTAVSGGTYIAYNGVRHFDDLGNPLPRFNPFGSGEPDFESPETRRATWQDYYNSPVTLASELTGTPYVWGGFTEQGCDCSGFSWMVDNATGIGPSNRYTTDSFSNTFGWERVHSQKRADWHSGDKLLWPGNHMAIWDAPGQGIWHASQGRGNVLFDKYTSSRAQWYFNNYGQPEIWRHTGWRFNLFRGLRPQR